MVGISGLGLLRASRIWGGWHFGAVGIGYTARLQSSSFLGLPYRILNLSHKKELPRSLWVGNQD